MKTATHILVALAFTIACVSLWALLTAVANLSPHWSQAPPAFTKLCMDLRPVLLALPVAIAAFCVFVGIRKKRSREAETTFIASTMTAMCLVFFPVLLAILLPCFQALEGR